MSLDESLLDFKFIDKLPGKKIILKGNHDYWWTTAAKMNSFFSQNGIENIGILNNNCFFYDSAAVCGTRGWLTEGEADTAHNKKIMAREAARLRASLSVAAGAAEILCFFHFPPRFKDMICTELIEVMNEYGVKKCWYGHIHGIGRRFAVQGAVDGIEYQMLSADFVEFTPRKIL
jgi:predicted phosphohydrolase